MSKTQTACQRRTLGKCNAYCHSCRKVGPKEQKQIQYENSGHKWTFLPSLYRNSNYLYSAYFAKKKNNFITARYFNFFIVDKLSIYKSCSFRIRWKTFELTLVKWCLKKIVNKFPNYCPFRLEIRGYLNMSISNSLFRRLGRVPCM